MSKIFKQQILESLNSCLFALKTLKNKNLTFNQIQNCLQNLDFSIKKLEHFYEHFFIFKISKFSLIQENETDFIIFKIKKSKDFHEIQKIHTNIRQGNINNEKICGKISNEIRILNDNTQFIGKGNEYINDTQENNININLNQTVVNVDVQIEVTNTDDKIKDIDLSNKHSEPDSNIFKNEDFFNPDASNTSFSYTTFNETLLIDNFIAFYEENYGFLAVETGVEDLNHILLKAVFSVPVALQVKTLETLINLYYDFDERICDSCLEYYDSYGYKPLKRKLYNDVLISLHPNCFFSV